MGVTLVMSISHVRNLRLDLDRYLRGLRLWLVVNHGLLMIHHILRLGLMRLGFVNDWLVLVSFLRGWVWCRFSMVTVSGWSLHVVDMRLWLFLNYDGGLVSIRAYVGNSFTLRMMMRIWMFIGMVVVMGWGWLISFHLD